MEKLELILFHSYLGSFFLGGEGITDNTYLIFLTSHEKFNFLLNFYHVFQHLTLF